MYMYNGRYNARKAYCVAVAANVVVVNATKMYTCVCTKTAPPMVSYMAVVA